jgi:hypothetical protein
MSILDALRVQKANQRSIADLAVLPQNEIIRLAQMGHIPADVVPVVISEKARMAKDAANLQAAAQVQGGMPTVIEQAMEQNAAAEAPAAGVSGLPTGEMFQEKSYQSGGIVAFNGEEGSFVEGPTGLRILESEADPETTTALGLGKYVNQYRTMTAPYRGISQEEQAYLADLKKGSLSPKDIEQQKWMRMLQASLDIMGGKSPYALANIAEGSKEALQGYASDIKAQKEQQRGELKTAAELARAKRLENIADVAGGAELYKAEMDRNLRTQIAKDSQLGVKHAQNYAAMLRNRGDTRNDQELLNEGYQDFFRQYGFASGRTASAAATAAGAQATQAGIATGAQAVQAAGVAERYATQAQDSVDKVLTKLASPESREYRRLQKESPEKAADYRSRLISARARELAAAASVTQPAVPTPAAGATPRPAPAASAPNKTPDITKIKGAPAGSTVGAFVAGKGWEIKGKDGTLLGYANQ